MSGRALLCFLLTLTFTIASCGGSAATSPAGGSAATSPARPSPGPVENCRGLTGSAPSGTSPSPTIQSIDLTVDGKLREYRVFRPSALDSTKPVPLVVVLHGAGFDGAGFETLTEFDDEATTAGFLAAYPTGCRQIWQYAGGGSKLPDLHFISKMLDQVETDFRIDPARIFVVGFSAGALMSYRLACDLSGRIAGIVSIGGTMFADECRPARPVSILEMHGTDDSLVPWQGGTTTNPVDTVIQRWRTLDGRLRWQPDPESERHHEDIAVEPLRGRNDRQAGCSRRRAPLLVRSGARRTKCQCGDLELPQQLAAKPITSD